MAPGQCGGWALLAGALALAMAIVRVDGIELSDAVYSRSGSSKTLAFAAPCVPPRMFSCSCRSARKLIEKMHALDEGARGAKWTYSKRISRCSVFLIAFTHPNLCVPTLFGSQM
jgi:hypothetical protein